MDNHHHHVLHPSALTPSLSSSLALSPTSPRVTLSPSPPHSHVHPPLNSSSPLPTLTLNIKSAPVFCVHCLEVFPLPLCIHIFFHSPSPCYLEETMVKQFPKSVHWLRPTCGGFSYTASPSVWNEEIVQLFGSSGLLFLQVRRVVVSFLLVCAKHILSFRAEQAVDCNQIVRS